MAKLDGQQVQQLALEHLERERVGMRWTTLLRAIAAVHPETPMGTIQGNTLRLLNSNRDIAKVSRGFYQLKKYQDAEPTGPTGSASTDRLNGPSVGIESPASPVEKDFYESFASWLKEEAEEVNVAVALGGNVLKGKWGTPDVLGVLRPRAHDILKFETQIVAAEIKIDPGQPVVAFGQAVAYRLFAHKSYIVVPDTTAEDDLSRLKALCTIHGVGLVTFTLDRSNPDYNVVVLPQQATPDMFYANTMLRRLLDAAQDQFDTLFG